MIFPHVARQNFVAGSDVSLKKQLYNFHITDQMRLTAGAELATFPRRALALALDFAIAFVTFIPVALPVSFLVAKYIGKDVNLKFGFFDSWFSVAWLVIYFGLTTYWWDGQTPGKRMLKIKVLSLESPHISLWQSIERALGYGASTLEFGFGFAQYFFHENRRTVHDRIANTIVISTLKPVGSSSPASTESA